MRLASHATTLDATPTSPVDARRLDDALAKALLAERGLADPVLVRHLVAMAHGLPRALTALADVACARPDAELTWAAQPNLAQALLDELIPPIPDDAHREALWCSAILLRTSEELIRHLVDPKAARALFGWLRGLACMRADASGLYPEDLVRALLDADLAWRRPGHRRDLLTRIAAHYLERLRNDPSQRHAAVRAVWFAWREELRFFQPDMLHASVSVPRPDDWPAMEAMVLRHFGPRSLVAWQAWAQADGRVVRMFVARDAGGEPCGLALYLALWLVSPESAARDPGTAPLYRALSPAEREGVMYLRFFLDRDHGQHASPTAAAIGAYSVERALSTPGLTNIYSAWTPPEMGLEAMGKGATERFAGADFELDGRRFGVVKKTFEGEHLVDWFIERYVAPLANPTRPSRPAAPAAPAAPAPSGPQLSPREAETLALLLQGKTEKEVAAALALSTHTVHQYVKSLYRHYGVTTRGGLVARALKGSPG